MGYELRRQLREQLGPDVTGLQRAIALEIADDASDDTRRSQATLEDLARWTAAKDVAVVRNALKRLAAQGWEFRIPMGVGKDGRKLYAVPGRRVTFLVPTTKGVATALPKGEPPLLEKEPPLPLSAPEGVAPAPSEGAPAPSQGAPAPSEGAPAPPYSFTPQPLNSTARESAPAPASDPFDAFWSAYPRHVGKSNARKAWTAALKRGADPAAVVAAAARHAEAWTRAQTEPHWIPHPSTWLNGERYDDEQLPASYQPPQPQQPSYSSYSDRGIF